MGAEAESKLWRGRSTDTKYPLKRRPSTQRSSVRATPLSSGGYVSVTIEMCRCLPEAFCTRGWFVAVIEVVAETTASRLYSTVLVWDNSILPCNLLWQNFAQVTIIPKICDGIANRWD